MNEMRAIRVIAGLVSDIKFIATAVAHFLNDLDFAILWMHSEKRKFVAKEKQITDIKDDTCEKCCSS